MTHDRGAAEVLVAETVITKAAGRVPVLIGTGAEDTREVVRLSRRAESLGADGVMIIPPFYSMPTDDEIVHHYKTVANAISPPILVYNNPATANVDVRPSDDGVVLNAAPLWELMPWKVAKDYWEELRQGKYAWSSIGKQLRAKGLVR